MFRAIVDARELVDPVLARRRLAQWQADHRDRRYRIAEDRPLNMSFATALDPLGLSRLRGHLRELEQHLSETLFEHTPRQRVLIAIPTPADAASHLPEPAAHGVVSVSLVAFEERTAHSLPVQSATPRAAPSSG